MDEFHPFSDTTTWCPQWRILPSNQNIEASLPQSTEHTINPDELKMTSITSNGCNRPPGTRDVGTTPLNGSIYSRILERTEINWLMRHATDIEDSDHDDRATLFDPPNEWKQIQSIQLSSNTIPTCHLSANTSPSTDNGWSDLTRECHNITNQRRSKETISGSAP